MLSTRTVFDENFDNDETFRLCCFGGGQRAR
jgi:hypothetical protein